MSKKGFGPKKAEGSSTDYQARAEQERKRFEHATDSEFWIAFCFKSAEDFKEFREAFGIGCEFMRGADFRAAASSVKPDRVRKGFPSAVKGERLGFDPLQGVGDSGDLEADCLSECMALFDALKSAKRPEPCRFASDSDLWVCVAFDDRDDKEAFLTEWNLWRFGDKYLDGSAWMDSVRA